jgi:hypothetical protein
MRRLFPDEMGAEASDIAELRRLSRAPEEATAQGHVVSRVTAEKPRPRLSSVAWALGVVAVAAGAVLVLAKKPESPAEVPRAVVAAPAPAPEASDTVEIGVQVSPAGVTELQLSIGGVAVTPAAPHRLVRRADGPVNVKVTAPGYRSVELPVVPDRDRTLMVTLVTEAPAVRAADSTRTKASATRTPAAAPSGVIRRYPF